MYSGQWERTWPIFPFHPRSVTTFHSRTAVPHHMHVGAHSHKSRGLPARTNLLNNPRTQGVCVPPGPVDADRDVWAALSDESFHVSSGGKKQSSGRKRSYWEEMLQSSCSSLIPSAALKPSLLRLARYKLRVRVTTAKYIT